MKKIVFYIFFGCLIFLNISNITFAKDNNKDIKQQAVALYATENYDEAFKLLDSISANDKTEQDFLLMANIAQEKNDDNLAIKYLNKAIDKNHSFYKAYYNLGCIFVEKKSYLLASNNFELAIKYNKTFASSYYNLAYCQMKLKNFELAKKNIIKAIELNPNNKDYYYNLAYCYKELKKDKQAQKILDAYNKLI